MAEKENITNESNTKEPEKKSKKFRTRTIIVIIALIVFLLSLAISCRADYLELLEIGEEYVEVFTQNLKYRVFIAVINFLFIFIAISITNSLIKKGLKKFFDEEKREMPKLPNKSLALIGALIGAMITPDMFLEKVILFVNNSQFGITEPVFGMDIGFYMFQGPLLGAILYYLLTMTIIFTVYIAVYYIIAFNVYFDGVDAQTLKNNTFIKHLLFNAKIITLLIVGIILFNTQNIVLDEFLTLNDGLNTSIVGAGVVETTIKLWGYRVLGVIVILSVFMAIHFFKKSSAQNVIKSLAIVPVYLVCLFVVMIGYNILFINGRELDREKSYISTNIEFTKTAYNVKINEVDLESTGTITVEEAEANQEVINNTPVMSEAVVLNNLRQTQTSTEYYTYNEAKPTLYGDRLVYISAREINSKNTTYNSKADEYTHGYGTVIVSANETDENGNAVYISKDFENSDIVEPRIYYGMETNSVITVSENNKEFDYPQTTTQNATNSYDGEGGATLNFLDKLVLTISEKKLSILVSDSNSKVLLNRNILDRAKKVMPYLIYDEEPYIVIGDDGNLYWVIDAYTVSNEYPYSQKTRIEYENSMRDINYIRNSVKVIINAYNGETNFYITDKTDPVVMVYNNMYKGLFKEESEIPEGISKYFTYSKFLYNIQANILKMYHDVSADVLYRGNDVWQIASYSNQITRTASTEMKPTYTMVKTVDSAESKLGLVTAYNIYGRESLNAYLVGTVQNGENILTLYKFINNSSVIGPMQLDSLIEQDETISREISSLNVTGTKITKEMVIVPIDEKLLYIVPIYQTSLNETNSAPVLKKVIVASGNKIAIGNKFSEALENLLSPKYSLNIEVEDTSTIDGIIDEIIKANNNLSESNNSNDWTQMGRDIEELQSLVKQLESMIREEEAQSTENENTNVIDNVNVVDIENVVE